MGAAYHLIVFTQYVDDPLLQYKFGWSIIAVTTLNIIVNMGAMGYSSFQKLKLQFRKLKQRYLLWKLSKAKKE
jgi:hypothetical protein